MRGGHPAPRMRPVELIDDDDTADERPWSPVGPARPAGPDGPDARPTGAGGPWPGRRLWPWLVGVLALAVASAGVATEAAEREARARADAFAALPGVVRPLDRVPVERWRARADGPTPVLAAGGAIVVVSAADGRWVVRGADPATGAERWSVPVVESARSGFESVAVRCSAGASTTAPLLCWWTEPDVVYGDGSTTSWVPATHVEVIDPVDGTHRTTWQVAGSVLDVQRHDDDLLVATALDDQRVTVERRSGGDGAVLWSWTTPIPVIDNGGLRPVPRLVTAGPVVVLTGHWSTLLDAATGGVLRTVAGGGHVLVRGLPDGGYATWEPAGGARLLDADGTVRGTAPALPVPVVGDATVTDLLVDAGNRVHAVDPRDGDVRWSLATDMTPTAVVDGAVVMARDTEVGVVDGRDGHLLWQHDASGEITPQVLTDGMHVLAAEPDRRGTVLVGRGLKDGVEVWRVPLPDDVRAVRALAGRVVVRTASEVVVLG